MPLQQFLLLCPVFAQMARVDLKFRMFFEHVTSCNISVRPLKITELARELDLLMNSHDVRLYPAFRSCGPFALVALVSDTKMFNLFVSSQPLLCVSFEITQVTAVVLCRFCDSRMVYFIWVCLSYMILKKAFVFSFKTAEGANIIGNFRVKFTYVANISTKIV